MGNQAAELRALSATLKERRQEVARLKAVIGLDGFIDRISKVVYQRDRRDQYRPFRNITEFSEVLGGAAGKSAEYELDIYAIKPGGNAPIMSLALGHLGVSTTCLGAIGYPEPLDVFQALREEEVEVVSYANPGITNAFEFDDGKLMFADFSPFNEVDWRTFLERVPLEQLQTLADRASLFALVDWSNIFGIDEIWRGMLEEVLLKMPDNERPVVFFDLADPSARLPEHVAQAMQTIADFGKACHVTLGLNLNEAERVYRVLAGVSGDALRGDPVALARALFDRLGIEAVVVHPRDLSVVVTEEGEFIRSGRVIERPKISTGGGDNFNAGYCLGCLLGLTACDCLLLGMAVSGAYVERGGSPTVDQLILYLDRWVEELTAC